MSEGIYEASIIALTGDGKRRLLELLSATF